MGISIFSIKLYNKNTFKRLVCVIPDVFRNYKSRFVIDVQYMISFVECDFQKYY